MIKQQITIYFLPKTTSEADIIIKDERRKLKQIVMKISVIKQTICTLKLPKLRNLSQMKMSVKSASSSHQIT